MISPKPKPADFFLADDILKLADSIDRFDDCSHNKSSRYDLELRLSSCLL